MKYLYNLPEKERSNIDFRVVNILSWHKKYKKWLKGEQLSTLEDFLPNLEDKPIIVIDDKGNTMLYIWIIEDKLSKNYICVTTKQCLSVRQRPDGLLGIQSINGLDTRLSNHRSDKIESEMYTQKFGENAKVTSKEEAHWATSKSEFVIRSK
jgi:hypothetical protein